MTVFITGVAGFIGSNVARRLIADGKRVAGFDNLCRGSLSNLEDIIDRRRFSFQNVDLSDLQAYRAALAAVHDAEAVDEVWHLAANSDIPAGIADAHIDLRDTFMTSFNTLQVMKELGISVLSFASSSAIYGDFGERRIAEDMGPLLPISSYGAMKLASEAAISAACENWLRRAHVFRFPNVIGVPATHGVIYDFVARLRAEPRYLEVLGNGTQQKSYLHCDDLIDAMFFIQATATEKLAYYNVGPEDDGVTVRFIAETVVAEIAPEAELRFGEHNRGWVGDIPRFAYSTAKLRALGWHPSMDSASAVKRAVREIVAQFGAGV
jgi:UDP-glucose 4-epimerase